MRDYTYQDMLKMQEDAANRVREMKKRAAVIVDDNATPKKNSLPDQVRHISYPVELPETQQPSKQEEKKEYKENHIGLIDYLKNDKDVFLILALLLILQESGECNQLTSLALLYILF